MSYVLSDTTPSDVGRTEERCGSRNAKAIVHGANVIVFVSTL